MGRESRRNKRQRNEQNQQPHIEPYARKEVVNTNGGSALKEKSGETIYNITGDQLAEQLREGNTRRVIFSNEGEWTPFKRQEDLGLDMVFVNSRYHVFIREHKWGEIVGLHLSIKRNDKDVMNSPDDWRDKMRIKNELVGDEAEAVELYPAMSRVTDSANQYHLWCLPVGESFPIGFDDRLVEDATSFTSEDKGKILAKLVKAVEGKGEPFDPVNNRMHKAMMNSLSSGNGGIADPKQRDCPSWMRPGDSTWRKRGGRFFLLLRRLRNMITSRCRRLVYGGRPRLG
jgi:hypothetical protein